MKRNKMIEARFTKKEKKFVKKAALDHGVSVSKYIRICLGIKEKA